MIAADLPNEALKNARLYPNTRKMLCALPKGGIVGEVGGDLSRAIETICEPAEFQVTGHLDGFPADHFDWLYIDASVSRDLRAAHRVVKPGGHLICATEAAYDLVIVEGYTVEGMALSNSFDMLIRRPRKELSAHAASKS